MRAIVAITTFLIAVGCTPSPAERSGTASPAEPTPGFVGVLVELDGKSVADSHIKLSVFNDATSGKPADYRLYIDCWDRGRPHPFKGQRKPGDRPWYSELGSDEVLAADPASQCQAGDPDRFNRIVRIMGVSGDFDVDEQVATMSSPLGTVRFEFDEASMTL